MKINFTGNYNHDRINLAQVSRREQTSVSKKRPNKRTENQENTQREISTGKTMQNRLRIPITAIMSALSTLGLVAILQYPGQNSAKTFDSVVINRLNDIEQPLNEYERFAYTKKQEERDKIAYANRDNTYTYYTIKDGQKINVRDFEKLFDIIPDKLEENNDIEGIAKKQIADFEQKEIEQINLPEGYYDLCIFKEGTLIKVPNKYVEVGEKIDLEDYYPEIVYP